MTFVLFAALAEDSKGLRVDSAAESRTVGKEVALTDFVLLKKGSANLKRDKRIFRITAMRLVFS